MPNKGNVPWNKGKSGYKLKPHTDEARIKISISNKGKKRTKITRSKMSKSMKGRIPWNKGLNKFNNEIINNIALSKVGEKSNFWKGGVFLKNYNERKLLMASVEYKLWRKDVFTRDNFTCVLCGRVGSHLNADHIKPFSKFPKLRLDVNNGRTLCKWCHLKTDTYGGYSK